MVETLFFDKPHRENMKNLQTKLYIALFSDSEYLVPLQSNEIFFRISSEKTVDNMYFLPETCLRIKRKR